jgi:hypothetical protein
MKNFSLLISWLFASASLVLADGIPVDRKTGKVEVPHAIVSLTAEQIEETQTLGTFTLTSEQWRTIRAKSPQCPKRFDTVVPVTWDSCSCGLERGYVIALAKDRFAVLHEETLDVNPQMLGYFFDYNNYVLRMNERGEFFLGGRLIPFPLLLKALASLPDDARRGNRVLEVGLPTGSKQTDAVFESRLRKVAAAADRIGLTHGLFPHEENE